MSVGTPTARGFARYHRHPPPSSSSIIITRVTMSLGIGATSGTISAAVLKSMIHSGPFGSSNKWSVWNVCRSSMVRLECIRRWSVWTARGGAWTRARRRARARRRSSRSFSFMSKRTGLFERCDSAKDVSRTRVYTMHVCADVRLRLGRVRARAHAPQRHCLCWRLFIN